MKLFTQTTFTLLTLLLFIGVGNSLSAQTPDYAFFSFHQLDRTINFKSLSHGNISGYAWDFGDGSTSTMENPSHTYTSVGSQTVQLTVSFQGGGNSSFSQQVTIGEYGKVYHDEVSVKKGSSNNAIAVLTNDGGIPTSYDVTIVTAPTNGTATVMNDEIMYTPTAAFSGWDVIKYKSCLTGSTTFCDEGYVFVEVVDGDCFNHMTLTPYVEECPLSNACLANGNYNFQTMPSPTGGDCFGYLFTFRNPGDETISEMTASIDIDPGMTLDAGSGHVYMAKNLNETSANISVEPDVANNRIVFKLATGSTMGAHEDYAYVFNVTVDTLPLGGAGGTYTTSLHGNSTCSGGSDQDFWEKVTTKEGSKCDDYSMQVVPQGCGVWGDIDTTVKSLIYTLNFVNSTPVMANEIKVSDILPQALDVNTVRVISGHPFAPEMVKVSGTNEVQFYYHDIHLPASLTDSIGAKGSVTFSVDLKASLPMGTPIDNWADVQFDAQVPPKRTDTTFNTLFAAPAPVVDMGMDIFLEDCDSCFTLKPSIKGGSGTYTYAWSTGGTTDTLAICPTDSSTYGLLVKDASTGCTGYDRINIDIDCNLIGREELAVNALAVDVYPNPFQQITHFRIAGDESTEIELNIFNSLGVRVAELYKGQVVPGRPLELDFDGGNLPNGMYFYHLNNQNGQTQAGRLMLAK